MYNPHKKTRQWLDRAWQHVQSVPYLVTLRWLFYRLLPDGFFEKTAEGYKSFRVRLADARKAFYGPWRPWTLIDDTRPTIIRGDGFLSVDDWIERLERKGGCTLNKWTGQKYYVELWFEAMGMRTQFEYYTDYITLQPFRGDLSIEPKWRAAKRLEEADKKLGLPIVILYFGDLDAKGLLIPESAVKDVRDWCQVDFELVRCGLNPEHVTQYNIEKDFERPGAYQWEALSDQAAKELITTSVGKYVDCGAIATIEREERRLAIQFRKYMQGFEYRPYIQELER